ncbi:transcriptional regulator [Paraconexibacter sp. AEG42_29]|uniref:Transcriptional regulator n=1 Tax=Paraconexibacter sp. AEG42_29 TaxID=2997339 RepID=A0AAU7AT86_9ACTN
MRGSWQVVCFCAAEAALVVVDVLFGDEIALSSVYLVPVLLLALTAGRRAVTAAGLAAVLLALLSGVSHDIFLTTRHLVRVALVAGGCGAAIAFMVIRVRLRAELQRQQVLGQENDSLLADVHTKERELFAVIAAIADAVLVHDVAGVTVYANQAAADILGFADAAALLAAPPGAIPGRFDFADEEGRPATADAFPGRRIFAGELNPPAVLVRSVERETGREMWTVTKATAVLGADGAPVLAVNVIEDVTDARRRQAATSLLAEAGQVLGASLDVPRTLERIVELTVPRLADWCSVDFPDGELIVPAATAHVNPDGRPAALATLERFPARTDEELGIAAVLRGEPSFVRADLTAEILANYARDPEHLAALVATGIRHVMIVGMRAGEQTIGAITFARGARRPAFGPDEVELAEELARRAGTAVLNARLYQARNEVADILQRSLLPPELPSPGGLTMAAHYRSTGGARQAGGDFYDAFPLPDGWLVAIGDVTGKGAAAAALTGLARAGLESVATLTGRPSLALAHLDGLLARRGDMALASVAALHFHAGAAPLRVSVFSAGHPAALLLRDGTVTPVAASGSLLGAFGAQAWSATELEVRPGDVVLLRTDGVTDSVGAVGRLGEERLRAALIGSPPGDAQAAVDRVRELVEGHQQGQPRDDVAVLAVAVTGPRIELPPADPDIVLPSLAVTITLDGTTGSVARARGAIDDNLGGILDVERVEEVRLLVSELASNAVKHAGGLDYVLSLDLDPHRLRVELADSGPGPVAGASSKVRGALPEGGYGLGIVDRLASRWGVERGTGPTPTSVWFEMLRD